MDEAAKEKARPTALKWNMGYEPNRNYTFLVRLFSYPNTGGIETLRNQNKKHTVELQKLNTQLENAYNLVEQGAYTLEVFKARQEKLNASVAEIKAKISENEITIARMEQSDNAKANLIPQTETLLASYDEMSNEERNALLKEILKKIVYKKEANGQIEIDLYPRLPKI